MKPKKIQQESDSEPNLEISTDIATEPIVENPKSITINIEIEQTGTINFEEQTTESECAGKSNVCNVTILAWNLRTLISGHLQPVLNTFLQSTFSGNKYSSFNNNYYDRFPDL